MAVRGIGNPPITGSVAMATDPASGTVMADSGAVPYPGNYEVRLTLSQSAAAAYALARRNAANNADVAPYPVTYFGAEGLSSQYAVLVRLEAGERVRVTMAASLDGQAQVLLQLEQME